MKARTKWRDCTICVHPIFLSFRKPSHFLQWKYPANPTYPIQKSLGYIGLLGPKKFRTSITVRSQPSIISSVLARCFLLAIPVFSENKHTSAWVEREINFSSRLESDDKENLLWIIWKVQNIEEIRMLVGIVWLGTCLGLLPLLRPVLPRSTKRRILPWEYDFSHLLV